MKTHLPRREAFKLLPAAAILFSNVEATASPTKTSSIALNAADSILSYKALLERVRGDAFVLSGKSVVAVVEDCNALLDELKEAIKQLKTYLPQRQDWPTLQKRFDTIYRSLSLAQGKQPGQDNAEALRSLPETLESAKALLHEASQACNYNEDKKFAELVDDIYSKIDLQNQTLKNIDSAKQDWEKRTALIETSYSTCAAAMDSAAEFIMGGTSGLAKWADLARKAIDDAMSTLSQIYAITQNLNNRNPVDLSIPTGEPLQIDENSDALSCLAGILRTTKQSISLRPFVTAAITPASYSFEDSSRQLPPASIDLSQDDAGLISKVERIVRQTEPRYFRPGNGLQTINCIAVCFPVWIAYNSDSTEDIQNRRGLIGSALAFGLIHGSYFHHSLKESLQGVYREAVKDLKQA